MTDPRRTWMFVISMFDRLIFLRFPFSTTALTGEEVKKTAIMKFLYYRVLARPVCQLKFQKADSKRPQAWAKNHNRSITIYSSLFLSPRSALSFQHKWQPSCGETLPVPKWPPPPRVITATKLSLTLVCISWRFSRWCLLAGRTFLKSEHEKGEIRCVSCQGSCGMYSEIFTSMRKRQIEER